MQPIRLLHLEDNPRDAELLHERLSAAGLVADITLVSDGGSFEAALEGKPYDIILTDYNLPGYDGLAAVRLARERQPDIPVIVVSGTLGEEAAVKCLHVGAIDYLIKARLERLVPAVQRALEDAAHRRKHRELEHERAQGEAKLRASEERLRLAQESAHLGVWDWDVRTGELLWTPELERLYGLESGTVIRYQDWARRTHPDDLSRVEAERDSAIAQRRPFEIEFRIVRDSGDVRWVFARGAGKYDQAGALTRVLGVNMDITERKKLDARLRQAQKMEAVGRLAGGVAHDFNNLLTVILGESEFAAAKLPQDHVAQGSLEEIHRAGQRAAALTRQLLLFSRQEVLAPTVFDVTDVLDTMEKMLRRLIGEDIELRVHAATGVGRVRMDRGQLEQLLMNLVINARDAMPSGGTLGIEATPAELDEYTARTHGGVRPGGYVLLSVSDSGIGMSEEVKAHLFEPFFTTKPAGMGTGLGLATCYQIAKEAGGHIGAYSEPGLGTTMKVFLPIERTGPSAGEVRAERESLGGHETILVVEDEESVRAVAVRVLKAKGYSVLEAESAETALRVLEAEARPVDLLLTDVILRGTNGRALAERAREQRPGLKVLFATGYTGDVTLRLNLLERGVALLHKPYTAELLGRKVRDVLDA